MGIDKTKIIPSVRFISGRYHVHNKKKYNGDIEKIIYRSSWERKFCVYCDISDDVIKWSSEPFSIPYFNPVKNHKSEYLIDFYARMKSETGSIDDYLIEIKPKAKLKKPNPPDKQTLKKLQRYNEELREYIINLSKFAAARTYAIKMGYKFIVITEDILFK